MKPAWKSIKKLKGLFFRKKKRGNSGRRAAGPQNEAGFPDKEKDIAVDSRDIGRREADLKKIPLVPNLKKNLEHFKEITGKSYDMNIREFKTGPNEIPSALIFVDGMVDSASVEKLLQVVKVDIFLTGIKEVGREGIFETIRERLLAVKNYREVEDMDTLYEGISMGETALLFNGTPRAILCETRGWQTRAVDEPESETTIRGPRDGFIESIRVNTSLIRRRISSPNLWIENLKLGSLTRTEVAFAYMKGLAGEELLEEVRARLTRIDLDGILESGYIEEMIQDQPFSAVPTVFRTERPDRVAAALLEGRVAIFTGGTPYVLVVPADFSMFLQAPDDYYEIFPIGTFVRILRYFSFAVSLFLPGIYVSVLNYHPELLPTTLLLRIQASREGVPFPVMGEVFLMEAAFEILREAGLRLPRAIGSAISIVGALVLGDAAIRAGLVSPGVVIVVAFTAISSFTTPGFGVAISARLLRFAIIILAGIGGLLGIQFALLALLIHLVTLRSFGHPFMAPFGPFILQDMKDTILRLPLWQQDLRPRLLGYREPRRQRPGQKPRPRKILREDQTGRKEK